jgi:hypothetical protein
LDTQLGVAGGLAGHVAAKHCPLPGSTVSASTAALTPLSWLQLLLLHAPLPSGVKLGLAFAGAVTVS